MFHGVFKTVSRLSQECFKDDSAVFQGCFKYVSRKFQENLEGEKDVSRGFQGCVLGCFREISRFRGVVRKL